MLISNDRILETVAETLENIQKRAGLPQDVVYDLDIAAMVLRHLLHVETADGEDMRDFLRRTSRVEQELLGATGGTATGTEAADLAKLRGSDLKRAFTALSRRFDAEFGELIQAAPDTIGPQFAERAIELVGDNNRVHLFGEFSSADAGVSAGEPLSEANLTAYFRKALSDPTAAAENVKVLTGGFGKETTLFTVRSRSLDGDFVMRRDSPIELFEGLDCHSAAKEFPLLKAMNSAGFPVPEPLFCESATPHIPGPPFTIMRRAPGAVSGDAMGGTGKVDAALQAKLAEVTARLHLLHPLPGLAHHPAFAPERWKLSVSECASRYIAQWYRYFLDHAHLPMPAMHALFQWLLNHVPESEEASTWVHGDIGFHNLLFDKGELSAVLDWEYTHVGDPAEDIGYIRALMGSHLDWNAFLASYAASGATPPSEQRVRFFEIWSHVRNAASILLAAEHFEAGRYRNIKYGVIVYRHFPHFVTQAQTLIRNYSAG